MNYEGFDNNFLFINKEITGKNDIWKGLIYHGKGLNRHYNL
jgi:hypothetical protein